jgi:hypothetical protein
MRPRSESVTRKAGDRDPVANPPACPGSTCSLGPVTVKVTVDPGTRISWLAGLGRFSSQLVAARAPAPPVGVSSSDSESGSWARSQAARSLKWDTLDSEATRRPTVTRIFEGDRNSEGGSLTRIRVRQSLTASVAD